MAMIAVHQPQYLPWLGYFDKIDRADIFVVLNNVQFKKNEWQNRNRIKSATGAQWITVPVTYKYPQTIRQVGIDNTVNWKRKHRNALVSNYRKAPYFEWLMEMFALLFSEDYSLLYEVNVKLIFFIIHLLDIKTLIYTASDMEPLPMDPDERLIEIVKLCNCDTYLAGAGGHGYMDLEKYRKAGIKVEFQEYKHPQYSQLFGEFLPYMSVVDLMFNHGQKSLEILRGEI